MKRSLNFVEEKIFINLDKIPPHSSIDQTSLKEFLEAWNVFWNQAKDWSEPASEIARICLLRVCQAHGDDNSDFMNITSMTKYKRQGTGKFLAPALDRAPQNNNGNDNVYDLNAYCKPYNETIPDEIPIFIKTLVAASAFLCLCDLCDIGRGKYDRCPQSTLKKLHMENLGTESIRETYWHWLGHILGRVSLEKGGKINVEIKRRTNNEYLLYSLVLRSGPIKALLYWGNHSNLLDDFKKLLKFSYCGVEPLISDTVYLNAWETAFKECQKNPFNFLLASDNGSKAIFDKDKYYKKVAYPQLFNCFLHDPDSLKNCTEEIRHIFKWACAGLVMDSFWNKTMTRKLDTLIQIGGAAIIRGEVNGNGSGNFFENSLVAALGCAIRIIKERENDISLLHTRLEVVSSLPRNCQDFWQENNEKNRTRIVMVLAKDFQSRDKCMELYSSFNKSRSDLKKTNSNRQHVLFFVGPESTIKYLESQNIESIKINCSVKVKNLVKKCLPAVRYMNPDMGRADELEAQLSSIEYSSLGDFLSKAFLQVSGLVNTIDWIIPKENNSFSKKKNSIVLLLSIIELLPQIDRFPEWSQIKEEYELIASFAPLLFMKDAHDVKIECETRGILLEKDLNFEQSKSKSNKILRELLKKKCEMAIWVSSLVMVHLCSSGRTFNVSSALIREQNLISPHTQLLGLVFQDSLPLKERIAFGFGLVALVYREFDLNHVKDFARALTKCDKVDSSQKNQILAFQIAYSLADATKQNAEQSIDEVDAILSEKPILRLGVFEMAAKKHPEYLEKKKLSQYFADIAMNDSSSVVARMSFDILCKYSANSNIVESAMEAFKKLQKFSVWLKICRFIHFNETLMPNGNKQDREICHDWGEMREVFHSILIQRPPELISRSAVDKPVIERCKELLSV